MFLRKYFSVVHGEKIQSSKTRVITLGSPNTIEEKFYI